MRNNTSSMVPTVLGLTLTAGALPVLAQDAPFTPGTLPTEYALVQPSQSGTVPLGRTGEKLIQFGAGGTGALLENQPNDDPSVTWSLLDDGRVRIVPSAPVEIAVTAQSQDCPGVQFMTYTSVEQMQLRRLSASAAFDQLEVETRSTTRYVDQNPGDACVAPAPTSLTSTQRWIGFHAGGEVPLMQTEVAQTLLLPHRLGPERQEWASAQWSAALFNLRNGSVYSGISVAPRFTHRLFAGRLQVTAADGTGSPIEYEFRKLQEDPRSGSGLFAVATQSDGRKAVFYELAMRQEKVAMPLALLGSWDSGFSETSTDPNIAYGIDFTSAPTASAPGIGNRWSATIDPTTGRTSVGRTPFSWTVSGATVRMDTLQTPSNQLVAVCPAATICSLQSSRQLQVLSRVTNAGIRGATWIRLNTLETLRLDLNRDGQIEIVDQRANFYQRAVGGSDI